MKKLQIIAAFILISFTTLSQGKIQKWTPAVKAGVGTWLDISSLLHVEIGAQLEYRSSEIFSLTGNVDFARNFAMNSTANAFNQLSISAGPRFYIKNKIFVGAGFGYIQNFYNTYTSYSSGALLLDAYAGYNTRRIQYAVDFKVNTSLGVIDSYISLMAAFKFGKKK